MITICDQTTFKKQQKQRYKKLWSTLLVSAANDKTSFQKQHKQCYKTDLLASYLLQMITISDQRQHCYLHNCPTNISRCRLQSICLIGQIDNFQTFSQAPPDEESFKYFMGSSIAQIFAKKKIQKTENWRRAETWLCGKWWKANKGNGKTRRRTQENRKSKQWKRYNRALGRVLRALFMFHGALAEPSWDGKQLDKQRGGEKCLANSKLETDGYIKQRKTGTNNG